ncbi:unnamed protein product [Boreogadus saida]
MSPPSFVPLFSFVLQNTARPSLVPRLGSAGADTARTQREPGENHSKNHRKYPPRTTARTTGSTHQEPQQEPQEVPTKNHSKNHRKYPPRTTARTTGSTHQEPQQEPQEVPTKNQRKNSGGNKAKPTKNPQTHNLITHKRGVNAIHHNQYLLHIPVYTRHLNQYLLHIPVNARHHNHESRSGTRSLLKPLSLAASPPRRLRHLAPC